MSISRSLVRFARYALADGQTIGGETSVWICPHCDLPEGADWLEDAKHWYDDACALCEATPDEDEEEDEDPDAAEGADA